MYLIRIYRTIVKGKFMQLKSFVLSESGNGNRYVYDRRKNSVLHCHKLLHHILNLSWQGVDIRKWIDGFDAEPIVIDGCGSFSKRELEYYYRKYLFLKDCGYFGEPEEEAFPTGYITGDMVEFWLANTGQLTFETTELCNLNCKYCGYGLIYEGYDKRENIHMDFGAARRLLDYLVEKWNSPLNMSHHKVVYLSFYGGEPLLNIDFIKNVVDYVKSRPALNNRIIFTMTTNALLLEKYMDYLVENKFRLLLSLDGNEKNNGYRVFKNGKPAYKSILKNIFALRDKYPAYFKSHVSFNAVLHNLNSVTEIHRFIKETFNKMPRVGELSYVGIKDETQKDFWKMYTTINKSFYRDAKNSGNLKKEMFMNLPDYKSMALFLLKYSGFVYEDYRHLISHGKYKRQTPTGTCFPFMKKIFVTATGKLMPCETIGHRFYLGKVTADSLELDYEAIAASYNGYFEKIARQCNTCYNKSACPTCIFNMNFKGDTPVCDDVINYSRYAHYIGNILYLFEQEPTAYSQIMEEVTIV